MLNPLSAITESPSSSRSICLLSLVIFLSLVPRVARRGDPDKSFYGIMIMLLILAPCFSLSVRAGGGGWASLCTFPCNQLLSLLVFGYLLNDRGRLCFTSS